jgi:hypothetical protein
MNGMAHYDSMVMNDSSLTELCEEEDEHDDTCHNSDQAAAGGGAEEVIPQLRKAIHNLRHDRWGNGLLLVRLLLPDIYLF